MEVVKDKAALLSNYEVLAFLKNSANDKSRKKLGGAHQQLATIVYETTKYLENTPCSFQSPEVIKQFKEEMIPFKLTKFETLQLLNQRPSTAVEVHCIIEDCEERLNEDDLVEVITRVLPTDEAELVNEEPLQ